MYSRGCSFGGRINTKMFISLKSSYQVLDPKWVWIPIEKEANNDIIRYF